MSLKITSKKFIQCTIYFVLRRFMEFHTSNLEKKITLVEEKKGLEKGEKYWKGTTMKRRAIREPLKRRVREKKGFWERKVLDKGCSQEDSRGVDYKLLDGDRTKEDKTHKPDLMVFAAKHSICTLAEIYPSIKVDGGRRRKALLIDSCKTWGESKGWT
jgi:hypothetical protein